VHGKPRIKLPLTEEAPLSTTKSDGMWQFHAKMSLLHVLKTQEEPLEFILPGECPIDTSPQGMDRGIEEPRFSAELPNKRGLTEKSRMSMQVDISGLHRCGCLATRVVMADDAVSGAARGCHKR
jgi:hypothetical protein